MSNMPYIFLKETAAERWHLHAVLLFFVILFESKHVGTYLLVQIATVCVMGKKQATLSMALICLSMPLTR